MPIQKEKVFICPAEDRNLSEVVILVTRHFYMETSKYMQWPVLYVLYSEV